MGFGVNVIIFGAEGVAAAQTIKCIEHANDYTMFLNGLKTIYGTGRIENTGNGILRG